MSSDPDESCNPTVVEIGEKPPAFKLGSSETDDKAQREKEAEMLKWLARELNKRHEVSFFRRVVRPLVLVAVTLIGLTVCFYVCIPCLFGILAFSAITCPCQPVMNVPLWGSIFILIIQGWNLTSGHLSLIWS